MTTTEVAATASGTGAYAEVNGINLYYERHRAAPGPAPRRARLGRDVRARAADRSPRDTGSSSPTSRAMGARPTSTGRSASPRWATTSPP